MRAIFRALHRGSWTLLLFTGGCATPAYLESSPLVAGPMHVAAEASEADVRRLPMYFGADGRSLGWSDVMDAVAWADVVFLGELHDDAIGHAVQRAIVTDALRRRRGGALSMEMLERDEQHVADDYLDGIIDAEQLATLTNSEDWGAKDGWALWYQPIVDAAKSENGRVIAANAPRRYVRLARTDGYDAVRALPRSRRELVELPTRIPDGVYADRFRDVLIEMSEDAAEDGVPAHRLDDAMVAAIFRSQLVWDATMAGSIDDALGDGAPQVVHLVGQFHTDFEGGTVQELRRRRPGVRILAVSMQQAWPDALREEDRGRADIVIYTGERPPEEEEEDDDEEEEHDEEDEDHDEEDGD